MYKNLFIITFFYLSTLLFTQVFAKEPQKIDSFRTNIYERKQLIRQISGLIVLDKKKSEYSSALSKVNPYPKIDFKAKDEVVLKSYDNYIKGLFPYFLIKLKNKDVNGELHIMFKAISLAKKMDQRISLNSLEKATFDFIYQSFQTEKNLRACGEMINKYNDKQKEIDLHLDRIDENLKYSMVHDLKKIKSELESISSDLKGAIKE